MANRDGSLSVSVRGLDEVLRALDRLPAQAQGEAQRGMVVLAGKLTQAVRAAGRADSRQAARAASTVHTRVSGPLTVDVSAGPHPLLFLSEFGMDKHTGWYGKPRYSHSKERNSKHKHLGGGSYWFFRTVDERGSEVESAANSIGDRIIANWGA